MTINCKDCCHFKRAPYEAPHTGCYHTDLMVTKQKDPVLDQQQLPGDHLKLNLHGDCAHFEAVPAKRSFLQRLMAD